MWFTGDFFNFNPKSYNPNDRGMSTVEVSFSLTKAQKFQQEFVTKQEEANELRSKVRRFKEAGARDLEQPYKDPETRI